MNCPHVSSSRLKLLLILLAPLLLAGCEDGKSQPMTEMQQYYATNSVTFDTKPGSVTFTSNSIPVEAQLTVTPSSATVSAIGDTLVFTASGGVPPYDWNVANVLIGSIQFKNGNPCVYVCKQLKMNSVWVTDHSGNVAAAAIEPVAP
jgi:hypothetical protein